MKNLELSTSFEKESGYRFTNCDYYEKYSEWLEKKLEKKSKKCVFFEVKNKILDNFERESGYNSICNKCIKRKTCKSCDYKEKLLEWILKR